MRRRVKECADIKVGHYGDRHRHRIESDEEAQCCSRREIVSVYSNKYFGIILQCSTHVDVLLRFLHSVDASIDGELR